MDHFLDDISKELAESKSRREMMRVLGGGLVAAALGAMGMRPARAQSSSVDCNTYCSTDPPGCNRVNCLAACMACHGDTTRICGTPGAQTCCPAGGSCCNGLCVNTHNDAANCGACGNACGANQVCAGGACFAPCATGQSLCTGGCVNTLTDNNNCGGCGLVCAPGTTCSGGNCVSCPAGQVLCGGVCVDKQTDPNNCGSCGTVCASAPNATVGCSGGTCVIITCNSGYRNCDGMYSTGCEVNTNTDPSNCGVCGRICASAPNASTGCSGGNCTLIACNAGYLNCDGLYATGCEVNSKTDNNNCGGCGLVCPSGKHCTNGFCV